MVIFNGQLFSFSNQAIKVFEIKEQSSTKESSETNQCYSKQDQGTKIDSEYYCLDANTILDVAKNS